MKTIGALGLVVLLLLGINYWQYNEGQALLTRAVDAEQTSRQNEAVVTTLRAQSVAQSEAVLRLAEQQNQLSDLLQNRHNKIRDLENENKQYRDWANTPLPDAAQRLRQRPAFTGASAYQQWMSNANTLPPPGYQPDQQRSDDERSGPD